jgi:hypothetical protein
LGVKDSAQDSTIYNERVFRTLSLLLIGPPKGPLLIGTPKGALLMGASHRPPYTGPPVRGGPMPSNMCSRCHRLIPLSATTCGACRKNNTGPKPRVYKTKNRKNRGYDNQWLRNVKAAISRQPYCSFCMTKGDKNNPLTGDHRVPISKGGNNTPANIRVLCRRCNSSRGNRGH